MPRNVANNPIRPDDWNHNDGFSPGQKIVTRVPGLDTPAAFQNTGAVPITDMTRYRDPDQPIVVINAETRQRHLIWAEIDSNPTDPSNVNLLIRPGVNFEEGARYIVALRNLRNASGGLIQAQEPFRVYRDNIPSTDPAVNARRPHMESLFNTLGQAGIDRDDLYLAWDFTVASQRNLSERALLMRDDVVRRARRHEPRQPQRGGHLAHVQRQHGDGLHAGAGRSDRAPRGGHRRRALLPQRGQLPTRVQVRLRTGISTFRRESRATRISRTSSA